MPMKCGMPCVRCTDKSCKQYHKKHWTCGMHALHLGDEVFCASMNKKGYIYDANPWGSKRSVYVRWYTPDGHNQGKLYWGDMACSLTKTGKKTTKMVSSL